jgi:hypothetical protein
MNSGDLMSGNEMLQREKGNTAAGAHRRPLVVLWLVLVGLLVIYGVGFLVVLKTNTSLLGISAVLGLTSPESLYTSPWIFFLFASEIHPGYIASPSFGIPGLLLKAAWLAAVLLGAVLLYRAKTSIPAGALYIERWRLQATKCVVICSAALLTAGLLSTLFEVLGLWTRLALYPDAKQEQGAPYWLWWMAAAVAAAAWYGLIRKSATHSATFRQWARRLATLAALSLLVGTIALLLHAVRAEPTQGRYYGIEGFVVGREQNYEYGTYYGMVAGVTAFMLTLVQFAFALLSARTRLWQQL